jgi:hypothetical protein
MATAVVTHASLTGAAANPDVLVDGPKWDAVHTVTGLENVPNVDTTNASNLSSGTVPAAQMPAFTGDVTTVAGAVATTIATNAVSNAKAAQMAANTIKGNNTGSIANASDLTIAQIVTMLSSSLQTGVSGGRLTLSSGVSVMKTDVAAATALYYAPSMSPFVQIYNGTNIQPYNFTASVTDTVGLTLTLGSNWAANTLYDVFATINGGVPVLATVAWTSAGAGTSARATALALYFAMQTNATSATARISNSSTITMAANQGTYLGTFLTNGSAGQIDFKFGSAAGGGGAATAGLWNMYNRALGAFVVMDTNSFWSPTSLSTWEPYDNSTGNRITFVTGLADDPIDVITSSVIATPATKSGKIAIGFNSTSSPYSRARIFGIGSGAAHQQTGNAPNQLYPAVGNNFVQTIQFGDDASVLFATGSPTNQSLTALWWW